MSEDVIFYPADGPNGEKRRELALRFSGDYTSIIRNGFSELTLSNDALLSMTRLIIERFPLDALAEIQ